MLPSGYLIRPCEGGGSIINIVDHVDLDVSVGLLKCPFHNEKLLLSSANALFAHLLKSAIIDLIVVYSWFYVHLGLECAWSAQTVVWIIKSCSTKNDNSSKCLLAEFREQPLWHLLSFRLRPKNWTLFLSICSQALRHIRQIAQETGGEIVYSGGRQPAVLRTFSQRLSR